MRYGQPKISIVTVVLNAARELQQTAISVSTQDYPDIEWIVMDGGSSDGTPEVIKNNQEKIAFWVSGTDGGIYEAMNKGLALATGDWVNFMNAGDVFAANDILTSVFKNPRGDADVVYGDSVAAYPGFSIFRPALPADQLWKGMVCSHQSVFFRRRILLHQGYDVSFRIAADHELLYRLYCQGYRFIQVPVTVAVWKTGGVSDRKQVQSARERFMLVKRLSPIKLRQRCYFGFLVILSALVEALYKIFPRRVVLALVKWQNHSRILPGDTPFKSETA